MRPTSGDAVLWLLSYLLFLMLFRLPECASGALLGSVIEPDHARVRNKLACIPRSTAAYIPRLSNHSTTTNDKSYESPPETAIQEALEAIVNG